MANTDDDSINPAQDQDHYAYIPTMVITFVIFPWLLYPYFTQNPNMQQINLSLLFRQCAASIYRNVGGWVS